MTSSACGNVQIGYDGVLPDTLLAAIRYLTMDTAAAEGDDHELAVSACVHHYM